MFLATSVIVNFPTVNFATVVAVMSHLRSWCLLKRGFSNSKAKAKDSGIRDML
jgi:hypothetical protein